MLEKAVYARRNHTSILAAVFSLALSASAHAADVARVELGARVALSGAVTYVPSGRAACEPRLHPDPFSMRLA